MTISSVADPDPVFLGHPYPDPLFTGHGHGYNPVQKCVSYKFLNFQFTSVKQNKKTSVMSWVYNLEDKKGENKLHLRLMISFKMWNFASNKENDYFEILVSFLTLHICP